MAYDLDLADRLRRAYAGRVEVDERKMFGGLVFMVGGHMSCGVAGELLMVRVGPEQYEAALTEPHAREMDFTGKPLTGFIFVEPEGIESPEELATWVERSLNFVLNLPPKAK